MAVEESDYIKKLKEYFDSETIEKLNVPTLLLSPSPKITEEEFKRWKKERMPQAIKEIEEMEWVCMGCGENEKDHKPGDECSA